MKIHPKTLDQLAALLCMLLGLLYLSSSGDFWRQLRTFRWATVTGYVVSNELRLDDKSASGKVSVVYNFKGVDKLGSDFIAKKFYWASRKQRMGTFIESFVPGKEVTIYVSDNAEISIGRFPRSYGLNFALAGGCWIFLSFLSFRRSQRIQTEKSKPQESAS